MSNQKNQGRNPAHVVIGEVRFSYAHVFQPQQIENLDEKVYSCALLFPKTDKRIQAVLKAGIEAAKERGIQSVWGGKLPANLDLPIRDGDDKEGDYTEPYEGMFYINAKSRSRKPEVIDATQTPPVPVLDDDTIFYSGCYGRAGITFFPYRKNGKCGISTALDTCCKTRDGEPLGSRFTAEDDFADLYGDNNQEDW